MNADVIDLIYQNEEVIGLAVFSREGTLIENQLSIDENSLTIVAKTIAHIAGGLGRANRTLKGFMLKSDRLTLMISVFDDSILLLELSSPFSADKIEKNLRSLISGSTSLVGSLPQAAQPSQPAQSPVMQVGASAVADEPKKLPVITPEAEVALPPANLISFPEYKSSIAKLMKRVAPGGVADKMIAEVLAAASVDMNSKDIDRDLAIHLGEQIVAKIPNAGRRKMIAKEYHMLSQNF